MVHHVGDWVVANLSFADWDFQHQDQLRTLLGLPSVWVEVFVSLQLRWADGKLYAAECHRHAKDISPLIVTSLMKLWQLHEFSDSRWLTLGPTCRTLQASLLVGLESVVTYTLARPGVSSYHLGGFTALDRQVKQLVALVSAGAFAKDAALALMMEDDRLGCEMPNLEREMQDELVYVSGLPLEMWELLSSTSSFTAAELRHQSSGGSYKLSGFVLYRLKSATVFPWSFTQGDRPKNLADLKSGLPLQTPRLTKYGSSSAWGILKKPFWMVWKS